MHLQLGLCSSNDNISLMLREFEFDLMCRSVLLRYVEVSLNPLAVSLQINSVGYKIQVKYLYIHGVGKHRYMIVA